MRRVLIPLATVSLLALGGCATDQRQDSLTTTLNAYASTVRWGDFDKAQVFIDPKVREAHPASSLELARFKLYKVSGYDEGSGPVANGKFEVRQTVQIGLVNQNTQSERTITDHQIWRYDETSKHWYLESGLPDIGSQP